MDKIINNGYRCSCNGMSPDSLVKVVQGNDIELDVQLTKYNTEQETWESYSLVGKDDVQCYLLTPNGTHINLDTEVELDGKLKAKVESYMVETNIVYGIGVDWKEDEKDMSVRAKDILSVSRYSEVTEEYDIAVTDNATYISIGQLPEDYVTPDEMYVVLDNYVTNSSLSTTLEDYVQNSDLDNYVTDTDLSTVLEDYITEADMSQFVTETELSSTLSSYATISYVNEAISNIPGSDMSNYYTKSDIDTTLQSYVTDSELNTTLNPYITETELSTTLNPYITNSELTTTLSSYITDSELDNTLQSYIDETELSSTLSSYATIAYVNEAIANIPGGGSGDVTMAYLDNYLEATAYALTQHESDLYTLNSNFSNYYDKTTSDSRYLSSQQASSNYVSISSNENQNQATAYALTSLDDRVTYIEQNGSGGGGGYVPTVNDATLTIQRNGTTLSYFTANAYSDVTCNITVPTDTNDLTNGANFVSSSYITEIVQISQNDYDALVSGGTVDSYTMYVIV